MVNHLMVRYIVSRRHFWTLNIVNIETIAVAQDGVARPPGVARRVARVTVSCGVAGDHLAPPIAATQLIMSA